MLGVLNTAVGTSRWSGRVGAPPKTVRAKQMPSWSATGVRLMRSVTSPIAKMLGTLVRE